MNFRNNKRYWLIPIFVIAGIAAGLAAANFKPPATEITCIHEGRCPGAE